MKKLPSVKAISLALIAICCIEFLTNRIEQVTILSLDSAITTTGNSLIESIMLKTKTKNLKEIDFDKEELKQEIEIVSLKASTPMIVYEGMTLEELGAKLDLSLSSTLAGYGMSFARHAVDYGVDPYMAVAITLLETGCNWTCSSLVTNCNNVGGMKGSGCGSYGAFETLDAGIEAMISNLSRNYIQKGLITPEQINTKYASSKTWATKVYNYMDKIRNA